MSQCISNEELMTCPFCNELEMKERTFYKTKDWRVLLAAPFHVPGHTILAAMPKNGCPKRFTQECLAGFDSILPKVDNVLKSKYKYNRLAVCSARAIQPHIHFHLIPVYEESENEWRRRLGYKKGHLLEYLGYLESIGDAYWQSMKAVPGATDETERRKIEEFLSIDVKDLTNRINKLD